MWVFNKLSQCFMIFYKIWNISAFYKNVSVSIFFGILSAVFGFLHGGKRSNGGTWRREGGKFWQIVVPNVTKIKGIHPFCIEISS